MTNQNLYQYHIEIQQLQSRGSVMAVLLKGRINDFYKENGIRIQTLIEKLKQIQRDFLVMDENDSPLFTGEGKDKQATLLDGKTMDEFNRLTKDLMETPVSGLVKV